MVDMFIKCAAVELAYHDIRVNGVAAGLTWETGKSKSPNKSYNERFFQLQRVAIPYEGRINESSDIAKALVWLSSNEASYMSGEIMKVDGGVSLTQGNYHSYFNEYVDPSVKTIKYGATI